MVLKLFSLRVVVTAGFVCFVLEAEVFCIRTFFIGRLEIFPFKFSLECIITFFVKKIKVFTFKLGFKKYFTSVMLGELASDFLQVVGLVSGGGV